MLAFFTILRQNFAYSKAHAFEQTDSQTYIDRIEI